MLNMKIKNYIYSITELMDLILLFEQKKLRGYDNIIVMNYLKHINAKFDKYYKNLDDMINDIFKFDGENNNTF
jgi:hypothetical protein